MIGPNIQGQVRASAQSLVAEPTIGSQHNEFNAPRGHHIVPPFAPPAVLPRQQIEKPITQDFKRGIEGLVAADLQFDERYSFSWVRCTRSMDRRESLTPSRRPELVDI
jgi:hypothetical protein